MSVAPINCIALQLTEEKSILEEQRIYIDNRRELIAMKVSENSTWFTSQLSKILSRDSADATVTDDEEELEFDEAKFRAEYDAMSANLNAQDKALEIQRTNLNTRLDAITTQIESVEKRLNKNVENEFKGLGS